MGVLSFYVIKLFVNSVKIVSVFMLFNAFNIICYHIFALQQCNFIVTTLKSEQ